MNNCSLFEVHDFPVSGVDSGSHQGIIVNHITKLSFTQPLHLICCVFTTFVSIP